MERMAWTVERLDDLAKRMDSGFDRVDADIRELRAEMRSGFEVVNRRIDAQVGEMNCRFGDADKRFDAQADRIDALRITIMRVGGGMMVGLVGVIAAVLAKGV